MQVAEIDNRPHIKSSAAFASHLAGGLVENFSTQGEVLCYVTLHFPAEEPIVLVARPGVNPVASSAVRRPWSPAFLHPKGNKNLGLSTSEPFVFVAGGKLDKREGSNLRAQVRLLDKSELGA